MTRDRPVWWSTPFPPRRSHYHPLLRRGGHSSTSARPAGKQTVPKVQGHRHPGPAAPIPSTTRTTTVARARGAARKLRSDYVAVILKRLAAARPANEDRKPAIVTGTRRGRRPKPAPEINPEAEERVKAFLARMMRPLGAP